MSIAVPVLPPRKRGNPKGIEKVENEENIAGRVRSYEMEDKIRSLTVLESSQIHKMSP